MIRSRQSEHTLQQACVNWFRYSYPELKLNLFAIPNGQARDRRIGRVLKDEGVMAGVSDLFLSIPRGGYHGFFIEMKNGENKPTADQLAFMENAEKHGYRTAVIWNLDEFMLSIKNYLNTKLQSK